MSEDRDELIDRIAATLQPLPEVDPAARARVLVAVAAERERDRERAHTARRYRGVRLLDAAVAAALLVGVGVEWRDIAMWWRAHANVANVAAAPASAVSTRASTSPATTLANRSLNGTALQSVQFVFRAPSAHRVSVVGDFTEWDARQGVMSRDTASGLWSTTLALPPGRHVYAYLIDDTLWVRDPRTPAAPDADFGRPGSVLLVGRP